MPSYTIRSLNLDGIPSIIEIQQQTWEPTYREILSADQISFMFDKLYSFKALQESMTVQRHQYFLLLDENRPVGFASFSEYEPKCYKLHKIYVLPATQGSGAGKFLIMEVENYLRSLGAQKLSLNVNRYNKAKSFYEKMNFHVVREEDIPIGPYWMNDFVLEKRLI